MPFDTPSPDEDAEDAAAIRKAMADPTRVPFAEVVRPAVPADPTPQFRPLINCVGLAGYPIHAIHLFNIGHRVFVDIQREDGMWARAITEQGQFSHEILANGMDALVWTKEIPTHAR